MCVLISRRGWITNIHRIVNSSICHIMAQPSSGTLAHTKNGIQWTPYLPQVFPGTLLPPTYPGPDNPGCLLGHSEVKRQTNYIQPFQEQLGEQHPLLQLMCQCLHNIPAQRPSGEELLQQLEAVRSQIKGTHGRQQVKVEMARLQVAMMSVLEAEVGEKDGELGHLRRDLQQVQVEAYICSVLC